MGLWVDAMHLHVKIPEENNLRAIVPMLVQGWASILDGEATLNQSTCLLHGKL